MKRAIAYLVLLSAFASGLLFGRQFPKYHYEMRRPSFVSGTTTGRLCDTGQAAFVLQQQMAEMRALGEQPSQATLSETDDPNGSPSCGK